MKCMINSNKFLFLFGIGCCQMSREIYYRFRSSQKEKPDIHTKLMERYSEIPAWWFYSLMALSIVVSLLLCTVLKREVQLPWWGLIFACGMAFVFTLPISIITATTNQASSSVLLIRIKHKGQMCS